MPSRVLTFIVGTIFLTGASHLRANGDHDHDQTVAKSPAAQSSSADGKRDHEETKDHDHQDHAEGHADEVKLTEEAVKATGIKVEAATTTTLAPTLMAPARVSFNADAIAHVGSPVTGRAVEIKVKFGATVRKGDELVVIESLELGEAQSDLIQKHTGVAVARAATRPAKDAADRARKLYDENQGIALAEVQKRQAESMAAEGAFQTAAAAAIAAENKLRLFGMDRQAISKLLQTGEILPQYILLAPINGTITEREVTQGELVSPQKEALVVIADLSSVWVWADVPEASLSDINVGSAVTIQTAAGRDSISGKIAVIAPQVSEETRTGRVRIDIPNPAGKLRPGMFVRAEIASGDERAGERRVVVPEEAIQTVEGKPAVFVPVEGEAKTFAKREVQVGTAVSGMVPVLSGLKDGEKFVSHGSFVLKADLGKAGAAHEH